MNQYQAKMIQLCYYRESTIRKTSIYHNLRFIIQLKFEDQLLMVSAGAMFGKGIYFSDTFEKSYAYTQDYGGFENAFGGGFAYGNNRQYNQQNQIYDDEEYNEIQRYKYLLLCELAKGKMKELRKPTNVENFAETYQGFYSIKGYGTNNPDPKQQLLLEDGTIIPSGKIIQIKPKNDKDMQHNEYIIYDEEPFQDKVSS